MPPETVTDTGLVDAILGGGTRADEAVVALLFDLCGKQLRGLARRFNCDEDDLMQNLYLHLLGKDRDWRVLRTWEGQSSLRTWVLAVAARSICLTQKRKDTKERTRLQPLNDWDGAAVDGSLNCDTQERNRSVLRSQLFKAANRLDSQDQRLMILLHFLDERPIEEVAEIMQTTHGNAAVIKHRALTKLRGMLEGELDDA